MVNEKPSSMVYLKDYRPPAYWIDKTELVFNIFEDHVVVCSQLMMRRNTEVNKESLFLHGVDLELKKLGINGVELSKDDYYLTPEGLTIQQALPDFFTFSCETIIRPHLNTALEGLYQSNDMLCTQCEAEGFRKITYYLDRPDVMSSFVTTIIADKYQYPILLSNGNEIGRKDLGQGRHQVVWEDPFKKPAYLFALVAGDLVFKEDFFVTFNQRRITLRLFVESYNQDKCDHALICLKKAMRWDEERYGREYDLDTFMIVAVDHFNMGAMENKGLNIFNSSCVLAKSETTTDEGFERIESIVAHEYFHNWSGNRVTCRDWFQLSLKEGFTVFRDQQFSADMNSPVVQRIGDVSVLRTAQFAEDAGPTAHAVRPDAYMEISNFYTLTVYEKGAEVVRMLYTLLGKELFRKATDYYFTTFDGQAVTTDHFVSAMEIVSGRDLQQFRLWYSQAGTPMVSVSDNYDAETQRYQLTFSQNCPSTPGQPHKKPFHIPMALGLVGAHGGMLPLKVSGISQGFEFVFELTEPKTTVVFDQVTEKPTPSLLRHFSAPVKCCFNYSGQQLLHLLKYDSDKFNRWEAGQRIFVDLINHLTDSEDSHLSVVYDVFNYLLGEVHQLNADLALLTKMLTLPSESYLHELASIVDVNKIHQARVNLIRKISINFEDQWMDLYKKLLSSNIKAYDGQLGAQRAFKNLCLNYACYTKNPEVLSLVRNQFEIACNMTDKKAALNCLLEHDYAGRSRYLDRFYAEWKQDVLVVEQWFASQASCSHATAQQVADLLEHEAFDWSNPNLIRAVMGVFAHQNHLQFHADDGEGYRFLADQVIKLDAQNPQVAARLVLPLTRWKKFTVPQQELMKCQLEKIITGAELSKDTYEVVSKSLL